MRKVIAAILAAAMPMMFSVAAFAEGSDQTAVSNTQIENVTDNGDQNITMGGNETTQAGDISSMGKADMESKETAKESLNTSEVSETGGVSSQNQI